MQYKDRDGQIKGNNTKQDRLLEKLYGCTAGRMLIGFLIQPGISKGVGKLLDSRISSLFVPWFIRANQMDISMCEKKKFSSYNDFFTRKFKKMARPICPDPDALISPCDGKLTVYPIGTDSRFRIKHTWYTVEQLLRIKPLQMLIGAVMHGFFDYRWKIITGIVMLQTEKRRKTGEFQEYFIQ